MPSMPKLIDIKGRVYGELLVLSRASAAGQARWLCRCSCGSLTVAPGYELRKSLIISCGCKKTERCAKLNYKHGRTSTKEYRAWCNMRNRCYRISNKDFTRYGGIGIKVCDRWLSSFESFFSDMGECPDGHSIDRIDSALDYTPTNCRWANTHTQANNRKSVKQITYNNKTQSVSDWCVELGLNHRTVRARIYEYHWDCIRAITTPIK